ncbi:MAG: isoprenylcysteine carboxylmethyltransferase family protein [Pirellulaceae bacterium]
MTTDEQFRLIFIGIIACFLPFALYHRIRSNMSGEKLDRWQEGAFILFGLRLGALPWFVGWIAWMIDPKLLAFASMPFPLWLRWCGFILIAFWSLLFVWTFRTLGKNLTDTVVTRKEHSLVTSGPYRYLRHPFYLAFFIAVVGGSIAAANWFLFVSSFPPIAFLIARTRIEEEKLVERFGDQYRDYMHTTGRFWPRMRSR